MPSSVIRTCDYDAARQELFVIFKSGRRYVYHRVPVETYAGLKQSGSKGTFFNRRIRDRFAFTRADEKAASD
jgi:hypothetical protein